MSENCTSLQKQGNPYKIVDNSREHKKGIIASSLNELINTARTRFSISPKASLKIVLEQDGTEVDDEEYFATLEKNTILMILCENEKWMGAEKRKPTSHYIVLDDTDHGGKNRSVPNSDDRNKYRVKVGSLLSSIHNEPSHVSLLAGNELEMLSDMDPDSVADIVSDRLFLEQLKEASGRFLADKRQVQESLALLHMFSSKAETEQT